MDKQIEEIEQRLAGENCQLVHTARVMFEVRIVKYDDPHNLAWEWDDVTNKWERHAFSAYMDLVATQADVRFLLERVRELEPAYLDAESRMREIHRTACPDCLHIIGMHAIDSRIVGCQMGDGSEMSPICGCRVLYGEAIQRVATQQIRDALIKRVREKLATLGTNGWVTPAELERLQEFAVELEKESL